jgi:anti-sigma factor RsiW
MVSMNCRRARQLLFDFFDGVSNETLRAEVDRHLGECADCEQFASQMAQSLALLRRAPVELLDETFNWKVRLAIHRERNAAISRARSAGSWVRMWNVRYAVSGGLAFGAVLMAGVLLLRDTTAVAPQRLAPATEIAQESEPARSVVPHSNSKVTVRGNDALVSFGAGNQNPNFTPMTGAIDSEKECRIDSLISSEIMRMSEHERELYMQRRIDSIQRLRETLLQSQQLPPAQR